MRTGYGRSFTTTGADASTPFSIACVSFATSCGVNPACEAVAILIWKETAGPLVVESIPSSTSTIGWLPPTSIFPMASATRGAHSFEQLRVRREQHDVNRLRSAGEVADHVLKLLREFHFDGGL